MRKIKYTVILILVLVAGGSIYYFNKKDQNYVHPVKGGITESIYGLGKVKTHKRYEVVLGVLSTVQKLFIDEGYSVKKGDPLIQFESGIVRAPFSGTITLVKFRDGETALPQIPIIRLEDLSHRYIELSLEQQAALRIRPGQKARISFEYLRSKVIHGKVATVFSREDEFIAHIQVPHLSESVLPGMTADVAVEVGAIKDAILVPVRAISNGMISVRRNGKWKKERVNIGHVDGMNVEIIGNNLRTSDEVLIKKEE